MMNKKKIDSLVKGIEKVDVIMKSIGVPEDVLEREVKTFGNGGHIVLPKQHLNKKVKIIVV
jgi:putative transposon-encoded protein